MVKSAERVAADSRKRIITGVAIGPTELCAADIRLRGTADRAWRATLEPAQPESGSWPSLASAFGELARAIGVENGTVAITLLPPLTEVRRLELPPLPDEELFRLLSRNASRYFVNARTPQMVGSSAAAKRTRGAPTPVVATAASARLVGAIRAAAEQAGWTVQSVAPAESAWAAASLALWPAFAKQNAWAAIAQADRTDILQIEQGRLVGVRRFRAGAADASMIADTVGTTARIGIAGSPAERKQLIAALASHSITAATTSGEWQTASEKPELLAANFAGREVGPTLRSEDSVAVARDEDRKLAWRIGGAAAALLVLAAALEMFGVQRQLRLVRAERERLRPQIASTMLGRTTVDATSRSLTSLSAVDRATPQWSRVIATLSSAITDDAYLTAIRARGDSLVIDGLAEHASRVFDALQRTKILTDVKSAAAVRRELQEDGTALDHFTISARVVPASSTPPLTTPAATSVPRTGR